MRLEPLPAKEYARRIACLQEELARAGMDVFVGYSSESESATSRYLAGFWPFFDFAAVVVPKAGDATVVTGGPESYEFAEAFSSIRQIEVNPLLVETSAPEWVPDVVNRDFAYILREACGSMPRRIGVANWNIIPHLVIEDIKKAAPQAELIPADELLLRVQSVKSEDEVPFILEAYRITEESMKAALAAAHVGMAEWELEAVARSTMANLGAEGTSYPIWVCSGRNTRMSLCRSTARTIQRDELVQLTFGAKYMGYCGNMCRPFVIGTPPSAAERLMEVALESFQTTLEGIRPGRKSSEIYAEYENVLSRHELQASPLYGPAHGTGSSEVEGLWLSRDSSFTIESGMLFNIDIWLSDGTNGIRYEDGILVTEQGVRELTSYRREIIKI